MTTGIQQLYSKIPKTYELLNHILTFGADIIWRKKALEFIPEPGKAIKCLDICTGTGDMARLLSKKLNPKAIIIGADFSHHMLTEATKKSGQEIRYINTEAKILPFKDNSFDLVTITFATRNLRTTENHLKKCMSEIHRVLNPGGIFIHLETSQPASPVYKWLFHRYVKIFIKPVGGLISGSYKAYAYLSQTIPRFYEPKEFSEIIYESGFSHVEYTKLWGGIAAIHCATKKD